MSKHNFKQLAEELETLLAAPRHVEVAAPVDESYLIAAEPQAETVVESSGLVPQLARTIIEYTLGKAPEKASAEHIGLAIIAGINESVKLLGVDRERVVEAVDDFLSDLSRSVRTSTAE